MPINVTLRASLPQNALDALPPLLEELFRMALEIVEVPDGAVEQVVIADDTQFGTAVYEFQDAAGRRREYTDKGLNLAVGKTVPFRPTPETVVSRIVLLSNIVLEALTPVLHETPPERWALSERTCFYIVCHELGHGIDNFTRRDDDDPPHEESPGDFRVAQLAKYYLVILKGELAASALSAGAMTEDVFEDSATQLRDLARTALAAVNTLREAYQGGDESKLYDLGVGAAHTFWTIAVQYVKLVASAAANPDLPQGEIELWDGAPEGAHEALRRLAGLVRLMWAGYPDWTDEHDSALQETWDRLAKAHGYEFYSAAEADGLRLH